ncbi:transcriptional regulator [Catellatospora sp. NPDC049133]|uniref:transcriptional regulator n=1 Tax=Catellatospora sp. NPDC049133 TaxID=3155499 RepID=UPI0033C9A8DB
MPQPIPPALIFHLALIAAVWAALAASHPVADHWMQTAHQATHKDLPGWVGRLACARHVATYTATNGAFLAPVIAAGYMWTGHMIVSPVQLAAGLAVSAITHYVADRRLPLRRIAEAVGSGGYFQHNAKPLADGRFEYGPGSGAFELDQAWHKGWLWVATAIIAL